LVENENVSIDKYEAKQILNYEKEISQADRRRVRFEVDRRALIEDETEVMYGDLGQTRAAWQSQQKNIIQFRAELEDLTKSLPRLKQEMKETEMRYQKALDKQSQAKSVGKARSLLTSVEEALSKIQSAVRECARKDVERAMNDFYVPLLLKNYRIHLTEDFHHKIIDQSTKRTIGVSSSEVALATFAFVGAIAALIPVYSRLEQLLPAGDGKSVGSICAEAENAYPVVLDAPYSPFGKDYAQQFSQAIPDLLPQSIIIVREDQLNYIDQLEKDSKVSAAYVLQLNLSHANTKTLEWNNNEFVYVQKVDNEETSHTKICRLPVED